MAERRTREVTNLGFVALLMAVFAVLVAGLDGSSVTTAESLPASVPCPTATATATGTATV